MKSAASYLEHLARAANKPEAEVMAFAFQVGCKQRWRERVLGQFLRREITYEEAIEGAGRDWVDAPTDNINRRWRTSRGP